MTSRLNCVGQKSYSPATQHFFVLQKNTHLATPGSGYVKYYFPCNTGPTPCSVACTVLKFSKSQYDRCHVQIKAHIFTLWTEKLHSRCRKIWLKYDPVPYTCICFCFHNSVNRKTSHQPFIHQSSRLNTEQTLKFYQQLPYSPISFLAYLYK